MNRKRAIAPCVATLVLFTLFCVRLFAVNIHSLIVYNDSHDGFSIITASAFLVAYLVVFVGIILKSLGTFSARLANKLPDIIGNYSLLIGFSILIICEFFNLARIYEVRTLLYYIIYIHTFALLVLIVIGTCLCKKDNSKLRNFAKNIWYLPGVLLISEFMWCHILIDYIWTLLYVNAYFTLGLWLAIPYFGAKKKALQPTMPVASANYVQPQPTYNPPVNPVQPQPTYTQPVQPARPAYTQPVAPVRPVYTPPVQPARPVYTPPVQPAPSVSQQQAKVTADANSQAQALEIYKDLLDKGTITQEDYDKKKKEILGL